MSVEHDDSPSPDLQTISSQLDDAELMNIPFDRYLLLRDIGEGAMGTVYEARQHEPSRIVAVKVMKSKPASAAAEARFIRESRLLATLNHPHVAQLHDAGVHRHGVVAVPYCVMELVRGASSITAFAQANTLTTKQRIELFLQVCAGVRHVHEHQILHCDLKPSNILVNEVGQVKVIDFGVARSMQLDEHGGTVWSDASLMFGTPQYMSPEQVQGHNFELDARSDVYALGVVLYELLCDRLPYKVDRTSSITAARSILECEPLAPNRIDRTLPREVDTVLLKAMSKDPTRRYTDVAALDADLRRLLAGEPVEAEPLRWYRTRRRTERWIARHRLFAAAATIIVSSAVCAYVAGDIGNLGLHQRFDTFLTASIGHVDSAPLSQVTTVRLNDSTDVAAIVRRMPKTAARQDTDQQVDFTDPKLPRLAHAAFLSQLARAGVKPRVVIFDIWFPDESSFDDRLAEAIRAIGAPVVVGVGGGGGALLAGTPQIAPQLQGLVTVGGMTASVDSDRPWAADLATTLTNGAIFPSIALMAASQCWVPNQMPAMAWTPDSLHLRYAGQPDRFVDVTSVGEMLADQPDLGLRQGSIYAEYVVEVPRDHDLAASSIDYQDAIGLSDGQLHDKFDGRVILVADTRPDRDGPFPHPDGRALNGSVMHAVTIERLLTGKPLMRPRYISAVGAHVTSAAPILVTCSIVGAILAVRSRNRRALARVAAYSVLAVVVVGAALLAFRFGGYMYMPLGALLCVISGGESTRLIYHARESTV